MINETEFEDFVYRVALENAVSFKGQANPKALLGKAIGKFPEMKKEMNFFRGKIENIVGQVNEMDAADQKKHLLEINPRFFEKAEKPKKVEKKGLSDLPGHSGEFIGRFAPAPSGYLHIGHLYNIVFNYEYKKKYGGKLILRFEDTNTDKSSVDSYKQILDDVKWITEDGIDEVYYQSDRLQTYYKYLRQLIETGHAYVCECLPDVSKSFNDHSEACPHRDRDVERQLYLFEKFFRDENGYKDGEAVIKFKGDLQNKNPALRDFSIARLNSNEHARVGTKYRLWPMYNFAVSVDDALMGVNYIVRGKDAEIGGVRQDMVKDTLGLRKCPYFHYGMMNFTDIELGKTPIKQKVEAGVYSGFDDPRVPTLVSFRRRGFKAEAFRNMIIASGISKRDSKISEKEYFKLINFHNKQILEKEADRFAFVFNPKEVEIEGKFELKNKEIVLPKHPEYKEKGYRKIKITNKYLIDGIDFENVEVGDNIRLMHFANFEVVEKTDKLKVKFVSEDYDKNLKLKRNVQFAPVDNKKCTIVMQDNSRLSGVCEDLNNPKVDQAIQFERFGFVRFDHIGDDGEYVFYFTQR